MSGGDSKSTSNIFMDGKVRDNFIKHIGGKMGSDSKPAKFTFRPGEKSNATTAIINPFPSDLKLFLENDSACKKLTTFKYDTFISQIPYVQIRAYMPHTIVQFIMGVFETLAAAYNYTTNTSAEQIFKDFANVLGQTIDDTKMLFSGLFSSDGLEIFGYVFKEKLKAGLQFRTDNRKDYDFSILDIPWNLYYKLVGATTNAVYEVPCMFPNDMLTSDGKYGWSNAGNYMASNVGKSAARSSGRKDNKDNKDGASADSNGNNADPSSGLVSRTIGMVYSGILQRIKEKTGIPTMPFFSPGNSRDGSNMSFKITFDLINDTYDHTKENFAFVQTLIANNKWLQYAFWTNPANLYDIRIPGGYRLFMCTGNFSVNYKGVIKKSKQHLGIFENETRIPEAYSVTMEFTSLLPDNFNTHMMGILKTNEDVLEIAKNRQTNGTVGEIGDIFGSAFGAVIDYEYERSAADTTDIDSMFDEHEGMTRYIKLNGDAKARMEDIRQLVREERIRLIKAKISSNINNGDNPMDGINFNNIGDLAIDNVLDREKKQGGSN